MFIQEKQKNKCFSAKSSIDEESEDSFEAVAGPQGVDDTEESQENERNFHFLFRWRVLKVPLQRRTSPRRCAHEERVGSAKVSSAEGCRPSASASAAAMRRHFESCRNRHTSDTSRAGV